MGMTRETFVPRAGWLYADVDYDTLELRSLAQVCLDLFGKSAMADALRAGQDLHLRLAADILGIDYSAAQVLYDGGDKQIDETRQICKVANFGFPGGMSPETFIEYAKGYGLILSRDRAHALHDAWKRAWGEMEDFFRFVGSSVGKIGEGVIVQVRSNRIRGGLHFCAAANSYFQGLAADGAKEALWRVACESYGYGARTALYGARPVLFVHDEIIAEVKDVTGRPDVASNAAKRLSNCMREAMEKWLPDVPVTCKPVLMRRWFKGAKPVHDKAGNLLPSKPTQVVGADGKSKTVWVHDTGEV